jgi:MerR family transcriptional regulator, light-induced transcriptional regulator
MNEGIIFDSEQHQLNSYGIDSCALATKNASIRKNFEVDETRGHLVSVVESHIIPRLLAAAKPRAPARVRTHLSAITDRDVAEFTELILAENTMAIASFIDLWRAKGVSVETIYLELLTGSARHLGTLWEGDDCDFCEVSLAIWRIQQIMYDLRPGFFAEAPTKMPSGYRVLLAPLELEQHTLGVMMTAEFFRRAGWDVSSELPGNNEALVESVREEYVDLVGISVASDSVLRDLSSTIAAVRAASINRRITIMVGGWLFLNNPAKAIAMGADFSAPDVRDAIIRGEKYVAQAWDTRPSPEIKQTENFRR